MSGEGKAVTSVKEVVSKPPSSSPVLDPLPVTDETSTKDSLFRPLPVADETSTKDSLFRPLPVADETSTKDPPLHALPIPEKIIDSDPTTTSDTANDLGDECNCTLIPIGGGKINTGDQPHDGMNRISSGGGGKTHSTII